MSSSSNVQSYLTNVFRPVYTYDSVNGFFQPSLELSNVDNLTANTITAFTAAIGDSNQNTYVGGGAGNPYNIPQNSSGNVGIGYGALNGISNANNNIAIGENAGVAIVNSSGNIFMGTNTVQSGNVNVMIGDNVAGSPGNNNVCVGAGSFTTGDNCIILGANAGANHSNQLVIGSNFTISGDLSSNLVGINQSNPLWTLDVNGYTHICNALGINATPLDHTLNLNGDFYASDGHGTLSFGNNIMNTSGLVVGSNGFVSRASNVVVGSGAEVDIVHYMPGIVDFHVQDTSGTYFASVRGMINLASTSVISSNVILSDGGNTSIFFNNASHYIGISNTSGSSRTYWYNFTYSPLGITT